MKKHYTYKLFSTFLFLLIFATSCNAQDKIKQTQSGINEPKAITTGQSKIIKTQGTDQYQNVHCGLQDKAGNLWFGTTGEGVYCYDGKSFTNFTTKDGLCNNTVWSILEDKAGSIWFGTAAGICRYDGKTFTSIPIAVTNGSNLFYNSPNNNPSVKNAVWSIFQDNSGKIWFGTDDGVYCYSGTFFTRFLDNNTIINKNGLHLKMVQCILEDKNRNIWFGSGLSASEGLCRYDGKSITGFKPNGDGWVRSILEDKNGNLWFTCRFHGVCRYDGKTFTKFAQKEEFSKTGTGSILEDKMGNIWFASLGKDEDGGVWCFDGKSFKNFTTKDGLSNNSVFCIVEDKAGNIWLGSRGMGLCRYDGKTFISFSE
ncbi:two component regulator with propeller domain [Chitinophaga niastensis]|uniref:Two component regulator with propeller domain n=1 Tax=Chitinophaga niastensis TaxID=536980 RepID=A0A2P8HDE9_CHINA|nr:two-component regulator propeller domain-containing protein [Chitinophaga niastensis]PSL44254.1 two component regulator with propeller domain [Chitinophaga niastensis]